MPKKVLVVHDLHTEVAFEWLVLSSRKRTSVSNGDATGCLVHNHRWKDLYCKYRTFQDEEGVWVTTRLVILTHNNNYFYLYKYRNSTLDRSIKAILKSKNNCPGDVFFCIFFPLTDQELEFFKI